MGEFSGYDVAAATGSQSQDSPNVDNKTNKVANADDKEKQRFVDQSKQQVKQSGESNILNGYRSVTYNFTLAALTNAEVNKPDTYRNSELQHTILKSGGKGTDGMAVGSKINVSGFANQARQDFASRDPRRLDLTDDQKSAPPRNFGNELINKFNSDSPGRFDMFIENIEIETLMAPSQNSNASLATKIQFEVIEPYSVNGFIEALHVAAVSAGYPNYLSACFLLKMEFRGYPDGLGITNPENVPNSTRYFPIGLTGIEVEITERGTKYKVNAVPYNERAFGQPSVVKKPIKMAGTTVKEILENFFTNLNEQVKKMDKDGNAESSSNVYDEYKVKFVDWSPTEGFIAPPDNSNKISKSKLTELYRDNNLYKLADPATVEKMTGYKPDGKKQPTASEQAKAPEKIKLEPNKTIIQFAEGMNVNDVITSVIRDSEYVRNILKDVKGHIDEFGMLDYFLVRLEVENQEKINEVSKKPYQRFIFVVSPYRIHYTRIPSFGSQQVEESKLKKLSLREYNYIYTGKNIDVINFKLNFNTLFFEAVPASMGNKDIPSSRTGSGPTNDSNVKARGADVDRQQANQVPLSPVQVNPSPIQYSGANASQPLDDPYSVLARNMHESIINSKAAMLTGELEILGDPFYIATNGAGNYNGKPDGQGKIANGEANHLYGELLVTINFRNPIDIMPLENGGTMYFDANRVPFSGVYRILKANSTFKEGIFKQRLDILRVPGQILDQDIAPTDPSRVFVNTPSPDDSVQPDSTRASPERRASDVNQLERVYPNAPTSGKPVDYTNVTSGGLAGNDPSLQDRVYGLVGRNSALFTGSSPIGQSLPTDVASNIRLSASGLAGLSQQNLGTAALAAIAANVITGNVPLKRAVGVVAGAAVGTALGSVLKRSNQGSGIGIGATVPINGNVVLPADATALDVKFGNTINPSSLPVGSINEFTSSVKGLGTSAINAVQNTAKDVGQFVNGIGDKITSMTSSPLDPQGVAAKLGLNTAAISGLSSNPSKIFGQVNNIVSSVPQNVDLQQAVDSGLRLESIPPNKMKNIPATQPYSTAPDPIVETAYVNEVVKKGGIRGLENLYGVNSISKLSSNIVPDEVINSAAASIPAVSFNAFASANSFKNPIDSSVLADKFGTVKSQLSSLTGLPNIKDQSILGSVSSRFGSASVGSSPLDKLVNKLNDPNAPPYTGSDPIIRNRLGLPPLES
jgi:hypothetical protein